MYFYSQKPQINLCSDKHISSNLSPKANEVYAAKAHDQLMLDGIFNTAYHLDKAHLKHGLVLSILSTSSCSRQEYTLHLMAESDLRRLSEQKQHRTKRCSSMIQHTKC